MFYFNFSFLNDFNGILLLFFLSFFLAIILIFMSFILINQIPDSEKLSMYECGYEPYESSRKSFNVFFCSIALFFLIFDIEIIFLLPWSYVISKLSLLSIWCSLDFLFELTLGLFFIWYSNAITWK